MQVTTSSQRRVIIAAIFGNLLEFYDFIVYSYFALTIGRLFFPSDNPAVSTILSFSVFAVGFIMRPLGGVVLGYYADRKGRRPALTLSIMLMALGSAMIGFAPVYASIGLLAPVIIVLARLLQGFAAGGELGAATATLLETGADKTRGYRATWQLASQGAASLLGAVITALIHFSLSEEALHSWGWRIPFLLGVLIVPVGIYLRRHIVDKPPTTPATLRETFEKHHVINWFLVVCSIIGMTVSTYMLLYYVPLTYSVQQLAIPERTASLIPLMTAFLMMVLSPLYGLLSDRMRRRKPVIITGMITLFILLYPAFLLMTHFASLLSIFIIMAILMFFFIMGSAPIYALMTETFPRHIRASYLATAYAVSVALFGGPSQVVVTWLLEITGDKLAPAWYTMACILVSVIAVSIMKETGNKPLQ